MDTVQSPGPGCLPHAGPDTRSLSGRRAGTGPGMPLSLPEVMLGIFPGWGGMQRLPRLIGAPIALDMMLSGKPQDARKAARLGLADGLVPPRLADQAAKAMVLGGKPRRRAKGLP